MRLNPLPSVIFTVARIDRQSAVGALNAADCDVNWADNTRTSELEVTAFDADLARTVLAPYLLPSLFTICWRACLHTWSRARFEIWRRRP